MTSKRDPETTSLAFCRRYVEKRIRRKQGVRCPCCRKVCKLRAGTISKPMLVSLVKMYLKLEGVGSLRDGNGDYAKLRHWGLVVQLGRGRWRLTPRGREFLLGHVEVPRVAVTYNRRCYELKEGPVSVFQCYGSRSGFLAMVARVKSGAKK